MLKAGHHRCSCLAPVMGAVVCLAGAVPAAWAGPVQLEERYTDPRVFQTRVQVDTQGTVLTSGSKDTEKLPLKSQANFQFRERRLPPSGRDAMALRCVREFQTAKLQTDVGGHVTGFELPAEMRLIVAAGRREGVESYSLGPPLTRDALDLLELPGDTLCILALLPLDAAEVGATWKPADWVAQMLSGIEAVESSSLGCTLEQISGGKAVIAFEGSVKGQRLGANTTSDIRGRFAFDVEGKYLSEAVAAYTVKAAVGTVNPGLEATLTVRVVRQPAGDTGTLTDQLVSGIPLEVPDQQKYLVFDAPPWGVRLRHDRNWHLFQSVLEGSTPVTILRLMELGSLVCQCNLAPVASAPAGDHTPLTQFEADIQTSLGPRFRSFAGKERLPTDDGRFIYRIQVEGEVELTGSKGSVQVPMNWIYYLCADGSGRQVSFVFSIEPSLLEQLAGRDREMVHSVQFYRPVSSAATPVNATK